MTTAALVATFWAAFMASHVALSSSALRPRLVGALGLPPFLGLYSLVAFVTFVPLVWAFFAGRHEGPTLWVTLGPPVVARMASIALMTAAFALFVCSLLPGSTAPSAMQVRGDAGDVHGLLRITRHPQFAAFALFGVAHLLVNGGLAAIVFFGGFPLFAWIGGRHQDQRMLRDRPGYDRVLATTSLVPFAAILAGRQRLVVRELPWAGLAAGVVLAAIVRRYHAALFQ